MYRLLELDGDQLPNEVTEVSIPGRWVGGVDVPHSAGRVGVALDDRNADYVPMHTGTVFGGTDFRRLFVKRTSPVVAPLRLLVTDDRPQLPVSMLVRSPADVLGAVGHGSQLMPVSMFGAGGDALLQEGDGRIVTRAVPVANVEEIRLTSQEIPANGSFTTPWYDMGESTTLVLVTGVLSSATSGIAAYFDASPNDGVNWVNQTTLRSGGWGEHTNQVRPQARYWRIRYISTDTTPRFLTMWSRYLVGC